MIQMTDGTMSFEDRFTPARRRAGRTPGGGGGGQPVPPEEGKDVPPESTGAAPEAVPEDVISQAKAAFARRSPGETAVLAWDSLVDEGSPAGDHRLRFDHPDLQIEVRIFGGGASSDLAGKIAPPAPLRVELQSGEGDLLSAVDAIEGTFAFTQVSAGMVRLSIRGSATAPEIRTDWFRI
jgi:hypothetical protein